MENFKVTCKKCKIEAVLNSTDDGACNDPECCGGTTYYTEVKCPKCGVEEDLM